MKRFISMIMVIVLLASLSVAAFAEEGDRVIMDLEPNERMYSREDGSKVTYAEIEDILEVFNYLRHGQGMYWGQLDSAQLVFEQDAEGDWHAVAQHVVCKNGQKLVSSDPNVVFVDRANDMHPTGAGEATVTVYDADDNELAVYNIKVSGKSFSSFVLVNECSQCLEDQSDNIHFMSCGHYSCEVGREGHGDAGCGYTAHFACDGDDHSICFNCLKPVCKGEHGTGVCPHVHNPVHAGWSVVPNCAHGGVEYVVCTGCGAAALVPFGPLHAFGWNGVCVLCGATAP